MTEPTGGRLSREEAIARLSAPFRPRRARAVGVPLAVGIFVVLAVVGAAMLGSGLPGWTVLDSLLCVAFGALLGAGVLRLVGVRAVPTADALVVRNVFLTTRVPWATIVAVRFGGGNPWLTLDLSDGENHAVMAIQRADGAWAHEQAGRLATLVELHTRPA
ncbi:PH (Pleckstrin Homology) domain-containing protein [Kineococcus xinjiangensis]|uniref:PH (Pleckstrin Homology) domain-containing protein n=1 Tax=Kineococcus xinjiangensis TaxID=512762 RepID=A0A2S6IPF8_9ACTN|nr:PH (Pleckstrin Homology) domain-containing protein [Kineococcus xinjiangensis]